MSKSTIEWTGHTWNPTSGCTKVSAGCKNCYAESMHKRLTAMGVKKYSEPFSRVVCHEDALEIPLRRRKPTTYFVNSMSDLFHKDIPFEFINEVFQTIAVTPQHTYQILTKRPERMLEFFKWSDYCNGIEEIDNIWLGVSVENTKTISRIKDLVKLDHPNLFISFEPLLEYIDLYAELSERQVDWTKIKWAIIGCESGKKRRDFKLDWAYDLIQDLQFMKILTFVKQLPIDGKVEKDITKFPTGLQIREMPIG